MRILALTSFVCLLFVGSVSIAQEIELQAADAPAPIISQPVFGFEPSKLKVDEFESKRTMILENLPLPVEFNAGDEPELVAPLRVSLREMDESLQVAVLGPEKFLNLTKENSASVEQELAFEILSRIEDVKQVARNSEPGIEIVPSSQFSDELSQIEDPRTEFGNVAYTTPETRFAQQASYSQLTSPPQQPQQSQWKPQRSTLPQLPSASKPHSCNDPSCRENWDRPVQLGRFYFSPSSQPNHSTAQPASFRAKESCPQCVNEGDCSNCTQTFIPNLSFAPAEMNTRSNPRIQSLDRLESPEEIANFVLKVSNFKGEQKEMVAAIIAMAIERKIAQTKLEMVENAVEEIIELKVANARLEAQASAMEEMVEMATLMNRSGNSPNQNVNCNRAHASFPSFVSNPYAPAIPSASPSTPSINTTLPPYQPQTAATPFLTPSPSQRPQRTYPAPPTNRLQPNQIPVAVPRQQPSSVTPNRSPYSPAQLTQPPLYPVPKPRDREAQKERASRSSR